MAGIEASSMMGMTGADAALDALPFGVVAMGADRVRANSAARAHGPALLRALAGSVRNRPNLIELNAATFEAQWTAYDGGWLVALADVSAHVERRERAEGAALTDPLTGLPNRAALAADLHGALEESRRNHQSGSAQGQARSRSYSADN